MTVGKLIETLAKYPKHAHVVVRGVDHSLRLVRPFGEKAFFDGKYDLFFECDDNGSTNVDVVVFE